ncbi:TPA: hypothetical protein N0F65_002845 [Lagenidium giganteum]|uniref:FAM32A-like protein n=1 Tax=Lagenidium giganteum TaxID=4803 RepID=A0AAV2ZD00_9STRA|nr:TPA: hypothetical protein N0F65_002845 [Lagenidium giganteum]
MEHVVRGKLKLKTGSTLKVASKDKKKKSKKSKKDKKDKKDLLRDDGGDDDERGDVADADDREDILMNDMTPAQRRYEEHRRKREAEEIEKVASKTYRERMEELNQHLSSLTEHHDIPRVSAAGNG